MANIPPQFPPPPSASDRTSSKHHFSASADEIPSFTASHQSSNIYPPAYTTDDILAAKYRRFARYIHRIRVLLSGITLIVSVTVLACAADALRGYAQTHNEVDWVLPLWPSKVDLRPAHAVLACGVIVTVVNVVSLAVALLPSTRTSFPLQNILSTILSFTSLFLSIFTTAFAATISSHLSDNNAAGTLTSWTCRWQGFESVTPAGFGKICTESMVALDFVVLMLVLQVLAVAVAGAGWWVGVRLRRVEGDSEGKEGREMV